MRDAVAFLRSLLTDQRYFVHLAVLLWLADALLCQLIIKHVRYTEIDWATYMQQVELWLVKGERNYAAIQGDTGPLVLVLSFMRETMCSNHRRAGTLLDTSTSTAHCTGSQTKAKTYN